MHRTRTPDVSIYQHNLNYFYNRTKRLFFFENIMQNNWIYFLETIGTCMNHTPGALFLLYNYQMTGDRCDK